MSTIFLRVRELTTNPDHRGADTLIENVSLDEIEDELAWKDRLIEFGGAPLSKVVYEFNLRNQTQIKIIDSDLRDRRITAAVRPDNVDGFIDLLSAALDIKARRGERV